MGRLRDDAETIWRAAVAAVDSARLVKNVVQNTGESLVICGHEFPLAEMGRLVVVGAGKAGAGMAAGFEEAVGEDVLASRVTGWVNVPADCLRPLEKIHLHAARPAGSNEPTQAGVEGALHILDMISHLNAEDVCVVLISGGGSALLPAPAQGITLDDKQKVTRLLMERGATINELNCVRKQLSRIKGGGLARAVTTGQTVTLIISDVIGDPLDVIASGPTVPDSSTPDDALAILRAYAPNADDVPQSVRDLLEARAGIRPANAEAGSDRVLNHIIGNNATALSAAADKARKLGYAVHSLGSENQGEARELGCLLADMGRRIRDEGDPVAPAACLLSGGEPVVHLVPTDRPRRGGRNQELVLAALEHLWDDGLQQMALLSGGTDGEDGPTDAAGAVADAGILQTARTQSLLPADYLAINNAYPFWEQIGGLLKTGPTHTNVMDVQLVLVGAEN